jgi:hypothetical protein
MPFWWLRAFKKEKIVKDLLRPCVHRHLDTFRWSLFENLQQNQYYGCGSTAECRTTECRTTECQMTECRTFKKSSNVEWLNVELFECQTKIELTTPNLT